MFDRKQLFIILAAGFVAIIFFILVVISAFLPKSESQGIPKPNPTQEEIAIPTSSSFNSQILTPTPLRDSVQLITVDPPDGSLDLSPIAQIDFTFTNPIKERAFYYQVSPKTSTYIRVKGTIVTISPKTVWKIGKNTITVYAESESTDGKRLTTPFTYSFIVKDLPFPDEEFAE